MNKIFINEIFINEKLKHMLQSAFVVPEPRRRQEFLKNFDYPKTNRFDFFQAQMGYIRKRVWILSIFFFFLTLSGVYISKMPVRILYLVSSFLPLLLLVSISELMKSTSFHMEELEMSCKYNFSEVCLTRLGILGGFQFILMLGIFMIFWGKTEFSLFRLGLYLLTPYLLSCYGSLFILRHFKSRETIFLCCGVTVAISIFCIVFQIQEKDIFAKKYLLYWIVIFFCSLILNIHAIYQFIKRMEEFEWNLSLTV